MSDSEDLLVFVYLHHGPEHKIIRGRGDLDVLHGAYDGTQAVAVVAHQRAGVYEVVPALRQGPLVRRQDVFQVEALRGAGYQGIGAGRYLQRPVTLLHDKRLRGGGAGDTTATLLHLAKIVRDGLLGDERADTVVYQDRGVLPLGMVAGRAQGMIDGVLACLASRDNAHHLVDLKLAQLFLQERNPILYACHHDGVYLGMIVEKFQGVDDDGLPVEFQELLGPGLCVHSETGASGEDSGYVHVG